MIVDKAPTLGGTSYAPTLPRCSSAVCSSVLVVVVELQTPAYLVLPTPFTLSPHNGVILLRVLRCVETQNEAP